MTELYEMNKSTLRKEALSKRNALSDYEFEELNKKLLGQFKTFDFSKINTLHIFLPIVIKKEPNTFLFIDWLQENYPQIKVIVPTADFETNTMRHYIYTKKTLLITNDYHIQEPKDATEFLGNPDLVIVPLLAFDNKGYRVGYGKGFYDRFLLNNSSQKIGLSFFKATEEIIDVHLNDIKLDKCITPDKIYKFI